MALSRAVPFESCFISAPRRAGLQRTSLLGVSASRLRQVSQTAPGGRCRNAWSATPVLCKAALASTGALTDVDIHTFDATLKEAGDRLVVLDMYTQWCGPCKLLAPKIESLAEAYSDVVFIKLDCNQENKPLAKSLGIRVVPTFKLFRRGEQIAEIVGAKYDELVEAIVSNHSPAPAPAPAAPSFKLKEGEVVEVNKENFYGALKQAGERLVVLDMYTAWCGPCKLLAPKLEELAQQDRSLVFLKLDCNEENKPLAKGLGIVSVPTVKFFKDSQQIAEIRGAKIDALVEKIAELR